MNKLPLINTILLIFVIGLLAWKELKQPKANYRLILNNGAALRLNTATGEVDAWNNSVKKFVPLETPSR